MIVKKKMVSDFTKIQIGESYNVYCAVMSNGFTEFTVPIIPRVGNEPYSDIDIRFLGKKDKSNVAFDGAICYDKAYYTKEASNGFYVKELVSKFLKCKRL